jgi:regulator of protease activity HflC (stomatin/prohibitin superfamily)
MLRRVSKFSGILQSPPLKPAISSFSVQKRFISNKEDKQGNIIPIFRASVWNPIKFLPQQYAVLKEQFGKYAGEYNPGLNAFTPGINELIFVIKTENVFAVTHQEAITSDNASVSANAVFYYTIVDPYKAVYGISDLPRALENLIVTNLRATMGDMTLDEVLKGRAEMNKKLQTVVGPAAEKWGVTVTRVEIKEIVPEKQLVKAMDQQMIAERDKRALETTAEGKKRAVVLGSEAESARLIQEAAGKKGASIQNAEAQLEIAIKEAEGRKVLADADAYSREKLAQSEAAAITVVAKSLENSPHVAQYMIAQKTAAAWGEMAKSPNAKTLFFTPGASLASPMALAGEILGLNSSSEFKK